MNRMTMKIFNNDENLMTEDFKKAENTTTSSSIEELLFDPTDLKHKAVLSSVLPDKESTWPYPKERDAWVHNHNAIRGDLDAIQECLEAALSRKNALEKWEVRALRTIYDAHDHFIYEHHTNEDGVLGPALARRIQKPDRHSGFVDHQGLVSQMENLSLAIHGLKAGKSAATLEPILSKFKLYSGHMRAHLKQEEDFGLPLMRAYFSPSDIAKVIQEINKNTSKMEVGCLIYHMGEKRFRSEFMKQEGIPPLLWYTKYRGALKLYQTKIARLVAALKAGVKP